MSGAYGLTIKQDPTNFRPGCYHVATIPGDSTIIDLAVNDDGLLVVTTEEGAMVLVDIHEGLKLN